MNDDPIFLGLGANIGRRLENIRKALKKIAQLPGTKIIQYSSVFESPPVGFERQNYFLNLVAQISTESKPKQLLKNLLQIEDDLGRIRKFHWGPRIIDIDILYWGDKIFQDKVLQIPHPEIENRAFVLLPLNEIASDFQAPPRFISVKQLLKKRSDKNIVELYLPKEKYVIN